MPVAVNIEVKDTTQAADPVEGVTVSIWSAADVFQTSAATNAAGVATFALNGAAAPGTQYFARFFKTGVSFDGKKTIYVVDPPPGAGNDFKETAETHVLPTATDVNYCRCSGYFVDVTGNVFKDTLVLILRPDDQLGDDEGWPGDPTGVGGRTVLHSDVQVVTDSSGFAQVDLPRTGNYVGITVGLSDRRTEFKVPDAASVSLLDLLFPVPASLTYDPDPVVVAVGTTVDVAVSVTLSDGFAATDLSSLSFTSADETLATVRAKGTDTITVTGVKAGAVNITATIIEGGSPSRVPTPSLSGATLAVTVQ